ncbi:MAG: hypothetical protein BZY82_01955 [SAR202 cluster bacterium Io17-Chloro-G3]|nr:MAG: hypothetical protein BZY82_01955 [SAR202 cluster bacterium Io17-Chloro-G3]
MKAAVLYEHGGPLIIEEIELESPKAQEVRVRIESAGICRSDLHVIHGTAIQRLPVVAGHEGSATVLEVGSAVESLKPGDRVILSFAPNCGRCPFCLTGHSNMCDAHLSTGGTLFDGTTRLYKDDQRIYHMGKVACFAQEAVVPETGCIPIPDDVPFPQAALIGCCVTTGVGATLYSVQVKPGDTVAVIGCGGVGINVIQGARLANASKIIAVDIDEGKLEFSMKFGATDTVNPSQQDVIKRVKEITNGLGVDYAFEVFGSAETTTTTFNLARKGGTAVVVGLAPVNDLAGIDAVALVRQEKTLKGTYYGSVRPTVDIHAIVDLYRSGKINVDDLVARHYKLEDINDAFNDLERGEVGRGVITQF